MKKFSKVLLEAIVAIGFYRAGRRAGVAAAIAQLYTIDPKAGDKLSDLMAQTSVTVAKDSTSPSVAAGN